MSTSVRGVAQVALAAALWGTWSLFLRPTGLSSFVAAPIIFAIMGAVGFALVPLEGVAPRWDRTAVALLGAYALLDAINVAAFFAAMQVTTVAVAVLTHCTAPLIVALLAPRVEGTRVKGSLAAALVALLGLTLLLRPWARPSESVVLGAGLGLVSAAAYASLVFIVQPLSRRIGIGRATSYHALLAGLVLVPFAAPELGRVELGDVALLAAGGLLPGALSAFLFIDGLRRVGSARGAVLTMLEPLVAVIVGWLVWGEELVAIGGLGAALVIGAALSVARREREPVHAHAPAGARPP